MDWFQRLRSPLTTAMISFSLPMHVNDSLEKRASRAPIPHRRFRFCFCRATPTRPRRRRTEPTAPPAQRSALAIRTTIPRAREAARQTRPIPPDRNTAPPPNHAAGGARRHPTDRAAGAAG